MSPSDPTTSTESSRPIPARRGSGDWWLLGILAVGLLARLLHWWAVRDEPFFAVLAVDSEEYDRWGREIAGGDWVGSQPFFQAPLYPYLLASIYSLFGHRLDAVYLVQTGAALIGIWALFRAGVALVDRRAGLAAAAGAALYGPFMFYDVQVLKTSFSITCVCLLLWFLAEGRRSRAIGWWLGAGGALGALALLRENALVLVPLLPWLAIRRGRTTRAAVARGGALLAGVVLALLPVAARNAWLGGGFLPTTYQGGVNYWIGNNPEATGGYQPLVVGHQIPAFERREPIRLAEQALGRELTEAEVSRYWLERALTWAADEPGAFAALQLRKLRLFWSFREEPDALDYEWVRTISPVLRLPLPGFGAVTLLAALGLWWLRDRLGTFAPVLLFVAVWTAATVAFFVFGRYRIPVVPALLLIGALPVRRLLEGVAAGERRLVAGLATAIALAIALPLALPRERHSTLMSVNLGALYERSGDLASAERAYRDALARDPNEVHAALNLGHLAFQAGRPDAARDLFRHAATVAPTFVEAWLNLGSAEIALGDLPAAERSLERARGLDPESPAVLHGLAVLAYRRGDLDRARELNLRVLDMAPDRAEARALASRLDPE